GSSSTSCIGGSYDQRAVAAVAVVRRSQGQAGNLVRGLEAPLSSPEKGSRHQTVLRGQARQREDDVSERPRPQPFNPPAPAHDDPGTRSVPPREERARDIGKS